MRPLIPKEYVSFASKVELWLTLPAGPYDILISPIDAFSRATILEMSVKKIKPVRQR